MSPALRWCTAALVLIAAQTVSMTGHAQQPQAAGRSPAVAPVSALADANNTFGFSLFRTLYSGQPKSNVFISPVSIALALEMAYDGARGKTARSMETSLHLSMGQPAVRLAAARLLASLSAKQSNVGLSIASSLWARSGVPFRPQFVQHARSSYRARVTALDFRSPQAPGIINAWVSQATQGKIPTIVDRIPPDLILYLINAVYFHGAWAKPFDPSRTRPHQFTLPDGSTSQVPLMAVDGSFPYYQDGSVEFISLPYRVGRFSMNIALPPPGTPLSAMIQNLTARRWASWSARSRSLFGSISLPSFHLTNDFALVRPLTELGMGQAFSQTADFSGMCVHPCRLSQARHKTYLKVDEKGTTAAGVSSIGVSPTVLQPRHFAVVVDRPFLLSIQDLTTGSILFFGAISNPS